jgi:ATP-dependent DNA ligase
MQLPVNPPVLPMLAKRVADLPPAGGWIFEPKWDGFRVLVFRDGDEVLLQSRDEKPLNRYFPEVVEVLLRTLPPRVVLDGELVVAHGNVLDFEVLQQRVHPAASRVKLLSQQTPASVVFFDLLAEGDRSLLGTPFEERRAELERLLASAPPPIHITPATRDRELAGDWFKRFEGAGLDGVMAKPVAVHYEPNKRVMLKVKHERECDCVVAGFRWHKRGNKDSVGSLLLGLYDEGGALHHVGVVASFTDKKRRELVEMLEPYRKDALAQHPWRSWAEHGMGEAGSGEAGSAGPSGVGSPAEQRMPGGKSRWSSGKDLSWEPVRTELVVEVAYDHMQGSRFRHTAQFRRFRTDKPPSECNYAQLEVVPPEELGAIFASGR